MNKNIPELRFPEFSREWEKMKLGDIGDVKMCRRVFNEETSPMGEIPFYKIGSFGKEADAYISKELYFDYRGKFSFPNKGDVLISAAGTIGRMVVYNGEDAYYQDSNIVWIANDNSTVSNQFLYYILSIVKFNTEGGTIQRLYNNILKSTKFSCPTQPEQTRIASFFTILEKKISGLKKKKALLEQYKKGVMQAIFSQKLRFKDENGEDYPEWEMKKLGDVCKIYDGTHQTPNYTETGIPFYSVEHITSNNFSNTKFISHEVFEAENKRVKLEKGDILMTRIGDIGTPKFIDWDVEASFYVSLALIKQSTNNNAFICQFIKSDYFQLELYKRTIHVAFPKKINLGEIGACLIMLPSLPEQTKIANFLTAIDEKLTQCQSQIEQTDRYKKGLLQKMFC